MTIPAEAIYDGDCGLCESTRRWAERHDRLGAFRWTRLQEPSVYVRHPCLSRVACEKEIHVIADTGEVYRGYAGMRFILERTFPSRALSVILHLPPVAWAGERVYRFVARNRTRVLACELPGGRAGGRPPRMRRWQRVVCSLAIVFVVAIQGWAIAGPHESWPFTSNAMFAFYVDPSAPRYEFELTATSSDGTQRTIDPTADLGMVWFDRLFFSKWYGSTDPRFPQGHHPDDTPAAFAARLEEFSRRAVDVLERRGWAVEELSIVLGRLPATSSLPSARVEVGWYDRAADRFELGSRP